MSKLKNKSRRKLIRFQGFQGLTFMFSRVRKKTSKFQGFQGTFHGKEKIRGIFKGFKVFKDRWPPCIRPNKTVPHSYWGVGFHVQSITFSLDYFFNFKFFLVCLLRLFFKNVPTISSLLRSLITYVHGTAHFTFLIT